MGRNINIREEIIGVLAQMISTEVENIDVKLSFEELGINSIQFVNLVVQCENMFQIKYEDEKLIAGAFLNAEDFIDYIKQRYEGK